MAYHSLFFSFVILVISALPPCYVQSISSIETERIALLSIKASIQQSNNQNLFFSSWTGHDYCTWKGVSCNHESKHVIKLDLHQYPSDRYYDYSAPASKLNSSLIQLHHLKHLDLSLNNFNDSHIPDFIGSLANLEYLNLTNTGFIGIIPYAFGNLSCLQYLDLSSSYLPILQANGLHWLSGMSSLQHLDMSGVDLSKVHGWLHDINMLPSLLVLKLSDAQLQPTDIHDATLLRHLNFTSLRVLDLSQNHDLHITLPQWLFNLTSLVYLDLSACFLYGKLPVIIGSLSGLRVLSLSENHLGGAFPESLGNLGSLERLDLSQNELNGSIPESLSNLTNLLHFDLSYNRIGKLPKSIGRLQKLQKFNLSSNQVQGWMPASIGDLQSLQYLDFSMNMITGAIPESFGNLTLLQHFDGSGGNNLSGKLPEAIGNLVRLQFLDLSENSISRKLPESLGNLSQLQQFKMQGNGITGGLPESIGKLSSLGELDLSNNNINGTLPKGMGNLCKLQCLNFARNSISGGIDDLVDGLSKCRENKNGSASKSREGLKILSLLGNKLNGTIPERIGQLSKLNALHLAANSLVGVLTESHFANLVNLEVLHFSYNSLQLNISENWKPPFECIFIAMTSCKVGPTFPTWLKTQMRLNLLCLSNAGVSGNIPGWFWNLSNFPGFFLNLSNNNLEGRLPTSLKNHRFNIIDLSSNKFEGPLPELDPTALFVIDLSNNSFSGSIPSYFAAATLIQVFSLSDNHISGNIPSFFCNLTSMTLFDVSNNDMSGELPNCRNLTSALEIIDLSDNNFVGKIPDGLVSFTNLRSLHLRNNGFSGNLPLSLKMANKLVILDIGENKLSGSIPTWIGDSLSSLIVLCLRSNLFEGVIPKQLSKLSSLQILDLAHNNLSGCIPHSFGDFKAMVVTNYNKWWSLFFLTSRGKAFSGPISWTNTFMHLESLLINAKGLQMDYSMVLSLVTMIDLSKNKLSCELPEELTKLHGLHFLNLSHNLFTGKIPESISDMEQLESLDLSINNFSGVIPPSISALNFLSHLNLSHNKLSGKIPSGNQLQTLDASGFFYNDGLCGFPLSDCTNETPSLGSLDGGHQDGNREWFDNLWLYIGLASGFIVGFWMFISFIMIKKSRRISYFQSIDRVNDWIYVKLVLQSKRLKLILTRRN
ncbi:receptor-like protein EIX1 [Dioscorea cayenensis subsp. rotundata]|uniref:Receptor-like protein EIX1 n=1 Tax=Dioscorea cayennensis subsp. rotundata TaxID=55577 RepID=A0AB40BNX8_DIOCR|nr:receptor-like protein EIX1 [Dioscorea cayenensis subsp. rotundata]